MKKYYVLEIWGLASPTLSNKSFDTWDEANDEAVRAWKNDDDDSLYLIITVHESGKPEVDTFSPPDEDET